MNHMRLRSPGHGVEAGTGLALKALADRRWAVRGSVSATRSDHARTALIGLVAWYERVCGDHTYDTPAPIDGLDALSAQERGQPSR